MEQHAARQSAPIATASTPPTSSAAATDARGAHATGRSQESSQLAERSVGSTHAMPAASTLERFADKVPRAGFHVRTGRTDVARLCHAGHEVLVVLQRPAGTGAKTASERALAADLAAKVTASAAADPGSGGNGDAMAVWEGGSGGADGSKAKMERYVAQICTPHSPYCELPGTDSGMEVTASEPRPVWGMRLRDCAQCS